MPTKNQEETIVNDVEEDFSNSDFSKDNAFGGGDKIKEE
jgi:hypothetical protein